MSGGSGDDTYWVDHASDQVIENLPLNTEHLIGFVGSVQVLDEGWF